MASIDGHCGGHFILRDLTCTKGCGKVYISRSGVNQLSSDFHKGKLSEASILFTDPINSSDTVNEGVSTKFGQILTNGVTFVAGQLEFCLAALPLEQLLTIRAFAAARNGNLLQLKSVIESSDLHHFVSNCTQSSEHSEATAAVGVSVDINSEYSSPSYTEESYFNQMLRFRSSVDVMEQSVSPSPVSATTGATSDLRPHKLLLHLAIDNRDDEMVTYLLEKGADVS